MDIEQRVNELAHEIGRSIRMDAIAAGMGEDPPVSIQGRIEVAMVRLAKEVVAAEREACAKIADNRAAICREAMSGPPESLPRVEVHTMNEALHIAGMIRARGK